jgi:peptidoglycan hydrolase-like protein with peptidoglycan-binding domain
MSSFTPSSYGLVPYGASAPKAFPCVRKGATDASSGNAVSAVQEALLQYMGLDPAMESDSQTGLTMTGAFDSSTDIAVRMFQGEHGYAVDGIVGPITGAKLGLPFQNCSGGFSAGGSKDGVDKAPEAPSMMDRLRVFAITQPGLMVGGAILAVVVPTVGYFYWKNTRG